jgi:hypothetical protein
MTGPRMKTALIGLQWTLGVVILIEAVLGWDDNCLMVTVNR